MGWGEVRGEQEESFRPIANLVDSVSRPSEFSLWGDLFLFSSTSVSESSSFALNGSVMASNWVWATPRPLGLLAASLRLLLCPVAPRKWERARERGPA